MFDVNNHLFSFSNFHLFKILEHSLFNRGVSHPPTAGPSRGIANLPLQSSGTSVSIVALPSEGGPNPQPVDNGENMVMEVDRPENGALRSAEQGILLF